MWKLFTEELRQAIWHAQTEAEFENSKALETRHLLLGVLNVKNPEVSRVLSVIGIDESVLESAFRAKLGPPLLELKPADFELSVGGKQAISNLYDQARTLDAKTFEPIHLLLGLCDVNDSTAQFLNEAGLRVSQISRIHQRI
ncbi:MAG: hypothetical protein KF836_07740 [Fimbriimonadaceae bacterium]|nr:hypothetical protein [Fimbriimonadaceae bacterium]